MVRTAPSPFRMFLRFLLVSSTTPGGGYAIIAALEKEFVRLGWMTEAEFAAVFALVQAVPGPVAFNVALVSGKRLAGTKGAILAGIATLIPPIILVVIAATLLEMVPDHPLMEGAIKGSYAVALGFVASIAWKVLVQYRDRPWWVAISLAFAALMVFLPGLFLVWFVILIIVFYRWDRWKKP